MAKAISNIEFVQERINSAKEFIAYCDNIINTPVLINTNCVIASEDVFYSVCADENGMAKVGIGHRAEPVYLTREAAERVAREFKAENGHGPIVWKVWGWKSYYREKKKRMEECIADMEILLNA